MARRRRVLPARAGAEGEIEQLIADLEDKQVKLLRRVQKARRELAAAEARLAEVRQTAAGVTV